MNRIARETAQYLGINFDSLIDDMEIVSYEEHRRGSSFYTRSVIEINEEWFPEVSRELDGFWETNTYVSDSEWGPDKSEIYELNRVEEKIKVVETTYWEKVK
jgi:hypothetical protein